MFHGGLRNKFYANPKHKEIIPPSCPLLIRGYEESEKVGHVCDLYFYKML